MKEKNEKEFLEWNARKQEIHQGDKNIYFRKGEMWWCALGLNVGHEQDGKMKILRGRFWCCEK